MMKKETLILGIMVLSLTTGCAELFDKETYTEEWNTPEEVIERSLPTNGVTSCKEGEIWDTEQVRCITDPINNINK